MHFHVREASPEELPAVLRVQRDAFGRVAHQFDLDPARLPPLVETLGELEEKQRAGTLFLVALDPGGSIIGSVRADESRGSVEVGRLVVDGRWTRRGVATALMDRLETSFPCARRFVLFTGAGALEPLALYEKRGYRECRREDVGAFELVWLEKAVPGEVL